MYRGTFTYNMLSKDSSTKGGLGLFLDRSLVDCGSNVHRTHPDYQRGWGVGYWANAFRSLIDGSVEKPVHLKEEICRERAYE